MTKGVPSQQRTCMRCGQIYQPASGPQKFCMVCRGPVRLEVACLSRRKQYWLHRDEEIRKVREWQEHNSQRYHESRRQYEFRKLRDSRRLVLEHYSNGALHCACCGESEIDFLTVDHIEGNGNTSSRELGIPRGGSSLYRWLVRNGFPPGFAVLCANCNASKRNREACIHQRKPISSPNSS